MCNGHYIAISPSYKKAFWRCPECDRDVTLLWGQLQELGVDTILENIRAVFPGHESEVIMWGEYDGI